jgi:hypothetical protein
VPLPSALETELPRREEEEPSLQEDATLLAVLLRADMATNAKPPRRSKLRKPGPRLTVTTPGLPYPYPNGEKNGVMGMIGNGFTMMLGPRE